MMKNTAIIAVLVLWPFLGGAQGIADTQMIAPVTILDSVVKDIELYRETTFDSVGMANYHHQDIGSLIQDNSGVFIKDYEPGGLSTISVRGASAQHTRVYWNGVAIGNPMLGLIDLAVIPVSSASSVSLRHGGASLIDGSGGLGGSLLLRDQLDHQERPGATMAYRYGSFDRHTFDGRLTLGKKRWRSATSVYYDRSQNNYTYTDYLDDNVVKEREDAEYQRLSLKQSLSFSAWEAGNIGMHIWWVDADRQLPAIIGVPSPSARQRDQSLRTMLFADKKWNKWALKLNTALTRDDIQYENDTLGSRSDNVARASRSLLQFDYRPSKRWSLMNKWTADWIEVKSSNYENIEYRRQYAIYLSGKYTLSHLIVHVAGRGEMIDEETFLLPSVAMKYHGGKELKWEVKGSYTQNIRYPTFNDLYWRNSAQPDLKYEQGEQFDLGARIEGHQKGASFNYGLGVTGFYGLIEDWILWQPMGSVWKPSNQKEVTSKGLETDAFLEQSWKRWTGRLSLNYNYTSAVNTGTHNEADESHGRQLIYTPEHKGTVGLTLRNAKYSATYRQRITGIIYIEADHSRYLPESYPASVLLERFIALPKGRLILGLELNNLFDQEYQYVEHRPLPGRNYGLNLRYEINR